MLHPFRNNQPATKMNNPTYLLALMAEREAENRAAAQAAVARKQLPIVSLMQRGIDAALAGNFAESERIARKCRRMMAA